MIVITSPEMNADTSWRLRDADTGRVLVERESYGFVQELQWALKEPDAHVSDKVGAVAERILNDTQVHDLSRTRQ